MDQTPSSFDLLELQTALTRHVTTDYFPDQQCSYCISLPRQAIGEFWSALIAFFHANMEQVSKAYVDSAEWQIQVLVGRIRCFLREKFVAQGSGRLFRDYPTPTRVLGRQRCRYRNLVVRLCQLPRPKINSVPLIASLQGYVLAPTIA